MEAGRIDLESPVVPFWRSRMSPLACIHLEQAKNNQALVLYALHLWTSSEQRISCLEAPTRLPFQFCTTPEEVWYTSKDLWADMISLVKLSQDPILCLRDLTTKVETRSGEQSNSSHMSALRFNAPMSRIAMLLSSAFGPSQIMSLSRC
jgi:hypothetical protein